MKSTLQLKAQYAKQESTYQKFFIVSSLFTLSNLIPDKNSPDFYQLNLGYHITGKDVISLELKTGKYGWTLN